MTKESLEQLLVDYGNPEICDDAISRRAAVYVASGFCHPANIATELAKLPPVTPQPKWIPVSERLPNRMGAYLVTLTYNDGIDVTNMLWWHNKQIGWAYDMNDRVKAWMPLPKPYESEGAE